MHDLENFALSDMVSCGMSMRKLAAGCPTLEAAANQFVQFLYDGFRNEKTQERNCVLVRYFQTLPYGRLEPALQAFARGGLESERIENHTKCLTLLATRGLEEDWNSRHRSSGHKAIPLPSPEIAGRFPMIAQLVKQFGIEIDALLDPDSSIFLESEGKTYNVFHVAAAQGSPVIPAQESFIVPYGVASVLGFGGVLPGGELFAFILFSRVPISRETADAFSTISLSAKLAVMPYMESGSIFNP